MPGATPQGISQPCYNNPLQPGLGKEIRQQQQHHLVMPESSLPPVLGTVTQATGYVLGRSYLFTSIAKQLGICFTFFKWSTLCFILQGAQASAYIQPAPDAHVCSGPL